MSGCSIRSSCARRGPGGLLGPTALGLSLLCSPAPAAAEWQIKPFIGVTFGPGTTYLGDLEYAAGSTPNNPENESGSRNLIFGASVALLGDVFGVEGDFGHAPGFFEAGDQNLVLRSRARTVTGNVVVALPRRLTEYTLRPYFVAGVGVMTVRSEDRFDLFPIDDRLPAIDLGGGATGFLTERLGLSWDLRHFRTVSRKAGDPGVTVGGERREVSFWRANMSMVVRY